MYTHIYTHIYVHMCSHGSQLRDTLLDSLQGLFWSRSLKRMAHPKYGRPLIASLEKESSSGKRSGFGLIAILSCWWVHLPHRCHCCHCCSSRDISSLMSELNPLRSHVGWKTGLSRNLPGLQHRLGQPCHPVCGPSGYWVLSFLSSMQTATVTAETTSCKSICNLHVEYVYSYYQFCSYRDP